MEKTLKHKVITDTARLDWLDLICERTEWETFWHNYMGTDIRSAIDEARKNEKEQKEE